MTTPYLGEIRMFGGNFAPKGWALCDGSLINISDNEALFSLLGTVYGGDGRTTFGLPDLRGRIPIHAGQGPGLTDRNLGAKVGDETVTLTEANLPSHNHAWYATNAAATSSSPENNVTASDLANKIYSDNTSPTSTMSASVIEDYVGSAQSHDNMMPYQCVNFIIALVGLMPSRT